MIQQVQIQGADASSAAPTPAPALTVGAQQLGWLLQRVGAASGVGIDRLQLHQLLMSVDMSVDESVPWTAQLSQACQQLAWPRPDKLLQLDEARLPLVLHHPKMGWLFVIARDAHGLWQVESQQGRVALGSSDLPSGGCMRVRPTLSTKHPSRALAVIRRAFLEHKRVIFEGVVASVLINVAALATSFYSMQVYDRVIPTQGYSTLWALSLGVFLSIVFELALKYVRSRVMEQSVVGMDATLSRDIFARLLGVRLDQLPHSVGSLAGQLRGYESIRALLTASTLYVLVDIPFALFFVVIMGLLGSPYMILVALTFLVLSLLSGLLLRRKTQALAREGARAGNEKTGLLVEAVEGAETIKAGHGGWRFLSRWIDVNSQSVGYDLKIRHISEVGTYLTAAFQQLSYGGLVAVGAWQVMDGHMTMGALIACSILSGRAMAPVGMLPGLLVQYAHAKAALLGLEQIYSLESDNAGVDKPLLPAQIQGHYKFEAVRYGYRSEGAGVALSIPTLQIRAGEKIGVLGPIGSGKSTLLRLLSGLYHPREGRILLDDLELSHISRQRLSEQIGYLQQDHRLFVGSLRDNLLIGLPDPGDEVILDAARQTGLLALISEHSKGLALPIAEGGKGLSGGQKQLVALTRLVLTEPRIWLLDEPTSSMDDELERRCLALLKTKLTDQHTAVIVTHKPSILPLVTRLIVIAKNKVILDGPRDEVLQKLSQAVAQTAPQTAQRATPAMHKPPSSVADLPIGGRPA